MTNDDRNFINGYRADIMLSGSLKRKLERFLTEAKNEDLAIPVEDSEIAAIETTIKVLGAHIESLEVHLQDLEES